MYEQRDKEHRRWAVCWQCGAQVPLDNGLHVASEKSKEKSLGGKQ